MRVYTQSQLEAIRHLEDLLEKRRLENKEKERRADEAIKALEDLLFRVHVLQ